MSAIEAKADMPFAPHMSAFDPKRTLETKFAAPSLACCWSQSARLWAHCTSRGPMRRRDFIRLLGGGAAAWPIAVGAQQPEQMRLIGVLMGYPESDSTAQSMVTAFRDGLAKLGWREGINLRIELRWGGADPDRVRTFAKELVDLRPNVILSQTTAVTGALARETQTIPVVFVNVADPVASGFQQASRVPAAT